MSRLSPPSGLLLLLFQTASLEPRDALDFNELSSVRKIAVLLDLLIVIIIILPFDEEGSKGMMRDCFFYTSLCHEITLLTSKLVY